MCSKRFLVHKVDRSVTGLVAQQQCVGPYQLPLSNCAVLARSHLSTEGVAIAVGEAPQLSALSPSRMAKRCACEMLTNLCWASVQHRNDVRLSANWMWAAKLDGEGARMYEACEALCDALIITGTAVDGGKDSLSMAAADGIAVSWTYEQLRSKYGASVQAKAFDMTEVDKFLRERVPACQPCGA